MLTLNEKTKMSKFLSLILRHHPEVANIELDSHGWANTDRLLENINLDREDLVEIVETDSKGRYSISEDGKSIRANQGHSINVDLEFEKVMPPEHLYHGTSTDKLDSISQSGLLPMQRQYVHLSKDYSTALITGKRYGEPAVLEISSQKMSEDGYEFFRSVNGVYLTKFVPCKYIEVLDKEPSKIKQI